jgi:hypothetical protein
MQANGAISLAETGANVSPIQAIGHWNLAAFQIWRPRINLPLDFFCLPFLEPFHRYAHFFFLSLSPFFCFFTFLFF